MIRNLFGGTTKCRTIDKCDIFGDGSGVALYRLDGNANDESGNYHGTETAITYGGGVYERAFVGDMTTRYINTNTPSSLFAITANFSISGWYKLSATPSANGSQLVSQFEGNTPNYAGFVITIANGVISYGFPDKTSASLGSYSITSTVGAWYHLVMTFNTSTKTSTLYINGVNVQSHTNTNILSSSKSMIIGIMARDLVTSPMNGSIDQVRIFNRAITATEVATLYAECEPTSIIDNINPFEDGSLKALYKFDGDSTDATGVYNGTATNVTYSSGKFGNCAVFSGTNGYISFPSNSVFDIDTYGNWSMSGFIAIPSTGTTRTIISSTTVATNPVDGSQIGWYLRINTSNQVVFLACNGTTEYTATSSTTLLANSFAFFTVTASLNNRLKLYINGKLESDVALGSGTNASNYVRAGLYGTSYQAGSIDQLRIFNKALTPLEVASLYNETTPMEEPMSVQVDPFKDGSGKALYRLEGNALDESGNYNGTATSVTYGTGRFGRCGVFNGSAAIQNPTYKLPIGAKSISFWVKSIVNNNYNQIINDSAAGIAGSAGVTGTAVAFELNTGKIRFNSKETPVNNSLFSVLSATSVTDGTFHNVVCTWDGTTATNAVKIYVDGSISNSGTSSGLQTSTPEGYLSIGMPYGTFNYLLNGSIDQIRIFNRALTQSEVIALYNEI